MGRSSQDSKITMKISDLKDGRIVRARWGRAGELGPWKDVPLYIQLDHKGNVCLIALRLPDGEDWAEYSPRDFYSPSSVHVGQGLFIAEDYYLEIDGLTK